MWTIDVYEILKYEAAPLSDTEWFCDIRHKVVEIESDG